MSTRKKCEAFAAENSLTMKVQHSREFGLLYAWYSVDLPEGKITALGNTGKGGDLQGQDMTMRELWSAILEDMQVLVAEEWVDNHDCASV
jgi:hypothetical protein